MVKNKRTKKKKSYEVIIAMVLTTKMKDGERTTIPITHYDDSDLDKLQAIVIKHVNCIFKKGKEIWRK